MIHDALGTAVPVRRPAVTRHVMAVLITVVATSGMACSQQQPAATDSNLQLSFEHYQAGRYKEAIAAAQAVLAVNPESPDAYNNMAISYLGLKMYDEGIRAAEQALRLRPDYQLARNNLAWIQQEKAKAMPAAPPAPPSPAADLITASLQHAQAGRFKECIDTATQAVAKDPMSAVAFNNLGFCAGNLQQWDDAIKNLQEAVRLAPDFQLARNNLAWAQGERAKPRTAKP